MNILYIDLNDNNLIEDYSSNPTKYGGGRIFASASLQKDKNFFIAGYEKCFENIVDKSNCIFTTEEQRKKIVNGDKVKDIIPNADKFDIFVYHRYDTVLNLEGLNGKQCCWAVGRDEIINPKMENLLLYSREYQNAIVNKNTKIYDIVIGTPNHGYEFYTKNNFIFQCSRHEQIFGSIQVAQLCQKYKIPVIFAGPIQNGYPLMDFVDNNIVKYIGQISETEKRKLYKEAIASTYLHFWQTPFNLSAIESLSCNTPLITSSNGFWPSLIKNGINGFIINTEEDFVNAIKKSKEIDQKACYETSLKYTTDTMIESFYNVFSHILNK